MLTYSAEFFKICLVTSVSHYDVITTLYKMYLFYKIKGIYFYAFCI